MGKACCSLARPPWLAVGLLTRRSHLTALIVTLAGVQLHCNKVATLKARFHASTHQEGGASEGALAPGKAGLDVVVTPPIGMTVLIDGVVAGHNSPLNARNLAPGGHVLYVRAMGYHSITLPLTLTAGQILHVPVSLRSRPPRAFETATSPPQVPDATHNGALHADTELNRNPAIPPPRPAPVPLPPGVLPVELHLVAQPPAPIVADGEPSDGRAVRLAGGAGTLSVGALVLTYTIGPGRVVDFLVPQDGCLWYREGVQVKAGSLVRLRRGLLRLQRTSPSGRDQAIVLRRLG